MIRISRVIAAVLLLCASVIAQAATPAEPCTVSQVVDFWVMNAEQLVVPAADAMPEAKYSFAPSNGEFSGVRTFAEQVKHLAAANYQLAAATLDELPPAGTKRFSPSERESIQMFLANKLKKGLSWRTVKHCRTTLGTILGTAEFWGYIEDNPVRKPDSRDVAFSQKKRLDPGAIKFLARQAPGTA